MQAASTGSHEKSICLSSASNTHTASSVTMANCSHT